MSDASELRNLHLEIWDIDDYVRRNLGSTCRYNGAVGFRLANAQVANLETLRRWTFYTMRSFSRKNFKSGKLYVLMLSSGAIQRQRR